MGRLPRTVGLELVSITVDGVAFEGISPSLSTTKISDNEKSCAAALRIGFRLDASMSRVDGIVKKNRK